MANTDKKYISLTRLSTFLDNLKNLFATKSEVGNKADVSHIHNDLYYTETEIDTKINEINEKIENSSTASHTHDISDINNLQAEMDEIDANISNKTLIQLVTWEVGD